MFSQCFLDFINEFGQKGGFDLIFNKIQYLVDSNFDEFYFYIEILSMLYYQFHRTFIKNSIQNFIEVCISKLIKLPEDAIRVIKKEKIDQIIIFLEKLMRRVFTLRRKNEELLKLRISLGLKLLKCDLLDKRIQAIRLISETCKSAKQSQYSLLQGNTVSTVESRVVSKMLLIPEIIEEIFGKNSHIQLIQRSAEILKFFLLNENLTMKDLEIIWECCLKDEQSKVEIYKNIEDSLYYLSKEMISFWISKLSQISASNFKNLDVNLLCSFEQKFAYLDPSTLKQALDLMWNISFKKNEYVNINNETREKLINRFSELITTPYHVPEKIMNEYLGKAYNCIENVENIGFALKILRKIIKQLPNFSRFKSRGEAQNYYFQGGALFNKIYKILLLLSSIFIKIIILTIENEISIESLKNIREEQNEIKQFLLFAIMEGNYKIKNSDLEILYSTWTVQHKEFENLFYGFLQELVNFGLKDAVNTLEDAELFLKNIIGKISNFRDFTNEYFNSISGYIISVNKFAGNLINVEKFAYTLPALYPILSGPESPQKFETADFKVKIDPKNLLGIDILWKIALECKNDSVCLNSIDLLHKLHTKLEESLENKISEISSNFIEIAIEKLGFFYNDVISQNINRTKEINMIMKLIEEMIFESERKGNCGITPFYALHKFRKITLKITDNSILKFSGVKIDEFDCSSSLTIWQLKMLISQKISINPVQVFFLFLIKISK